MTLQIQKDIPVCSRSINPPVDLQNVLITPSGIKRHNSFTSLESNDCIVLTCSVGKARA